eukprot:CAMPEP_0170184036 /NCGR_PEP_ID=MMETSP0040_2-20121228/32539_1 /TAXON_ID=641309 /ORGANISM="Lotharella oceanica, Strain CCMP622" /LENGTH=305 /DNA_ID=CAMNT_0010429963 /DNA_START=37 /DNA_END=954 /DNA_ORIENTATION=+
MTSIGRHLFCAGFSASLASGITAPLDVIRIRRQLFGSFKASQSSIFCYYQSPSAIRKASASGLDIVKKTFKQQGFQGFWTGYSSEAIRQWTYGCARIGLHRVFSGKLAEAQGAPLELHQLVGCAALSGILAVPLQIPFDKIKIRQIKDTWHHGNSRYKNVFHGLSSLRDCPEFGPDFRKVLPAAMVRTVVGNVAGIATFDILKQNVGPKLELSKTTSTILFSVVASCCNTLCMAPLDSLRNRIIASPNRYTSITVAAVRILREEGPLGFYRGASVTASANWIHNFTILNVCEIAGSVLDKANKGQ